MISQVAAHPVTYMFVCLFVCLFTSIFVCVFSFVTIAANAPASHGVQLILL